MSEKQITQRVPESVRSQEEDTIDLVELACALLDKWTILLAAAVSCALIAAIVVNFFVVPKYKATATLYVISRKDSAINISDLQIGTELTSDYIRVFKMWEVQEQVISNLDLPYSYGQLASMVSVTNASDTRLLDISVTSDSPQEAADVANEFAKVTSEYIAKKMVTEKPSIISTALVPTAPVSPNKTKTILLGAVLGFVASAGVIVLITLMNDTYKTAEDLRDYAGLVTLAVIPVDKTEEKHSQQGSPRKKWKLPGRKSA